MLSSVISHPAPTFCIQVPMFDATDAIHSARKSVWVSGAQGCSVVVESDAAVALAAMGTATKAALEPVTSHGDIILRQVVTSFSPM